MNNIEVTVRVIIKRGDNILLCWTKSGKHFFVPGGHVEFKDSLVDTIYKEIKEETGLNKNQIHDIAYVNFIENIFYADNREHHEINFIYSATIDENLAIKSQEDHLNFEWIKISEIDNTNILPKAIVPFLK